MAVGACDILCAAMPALIGLAIAMSLWLVLWAIGAKAVDASLLSFVIMLGVAAAVAYIPLVRSALGHDDE